MEATAIFLPEGTRADPDLTGYASVQDDRGTPYLLIGGALMVKAGSRGARVVLMILLALGAFWDLRMSLVKFAAANGVWPYGYMF